MTYAAESLGAGVNNVEDAGGPVTHYGFVLIPHCGEHYLAGDEKEGRTSSEGLFVTLELGGGWFSTFGTCRIRIWIGEYLCLHD